MMDDKRAAIGFGLAGILISALLLCASAHTVYAQEQEPETQTKPATTKRVSSSGRDPFRRYEPPRPTVKKLSGQVLPPSIQERIESYKAQKLAAMNARMPAPKPTTALLLNEIQVIGISRTPRGYAAIIEATPIKLSYVIYPGEPFYDGQLVAIEDTRLVFRHEIVFTDGRRERSVQLKSLRPTSPVNSLSAAGATVSVKP
jgi:hypothetical protein